MTRFELNTEIMLQILKVNSALLELTMKKTHMTSKDRNEMIKKFGLSDRVTELTETHNKLNK